MSTSSHPTTLAIDAGTAEPLRSRRCPTCDGTRAHYAFSNGPVRVLQCADCRFTFRTAPVPPPRSARAAAEELIQRVGGEAELRQQVLPAHELEAARLEILDWSNVGVHATAGTSDMSVSGTVLLSVGQLESSTNLVESLTAWREQLPAGQRVVFVYSDIRRSGAEVGSRTWEKLLEQRNTYLDTHTALTVLFRAGFRSLALQRLRRRISLDELLESDAHALVTRRLRQRLLRLLPRALRRTIQVTSRTTEVAILAEPRPTPGLLVSIVVPVFNEARTVGAVLDAILQVTIEGATVEVIVVESNSTDGSRAIVESYANDPRVTCVYEDRPRGKGHATRVGLAHARGDILLIQDADLEYDFEDYHSLIEPIVRGHQAFMLGSRHGGRNHWKLRQFQRPLLAGFYNLAHVLVTSYINLLFGLSLRDPQTMFKVCRRDCIAGLRFSGNYFNFDYELLLKIVRKGYEPQEVPVNYRSRSHAEGKKIRMWRDAPLGLWMITKLRLTPLRRFLAFGEPVE